MNSGDDTLSTTAQLLCQAEQEAQTRGQGQSLLQDVRTAIANLKAADQSVSRRSVRVEVGRGSLRDIHAIMNQIEAEETEQLKPASLTDDDKRIVLQFGESVFAVLRDRLASIIKDREDALASQISQARHSADDAVEAADRATAEAREEIDAALAAKAKAEQGRAHAEEGAAEARQEAQQAAGKVTLLITERENLAQQLHATEERLNFALAGEEAAIASSVKSEAALHTVSTELRTARDKIDDLQGKLQVAETSRAIAEAEAQTLAQTAKATSESLAQLTANHDATTKALTAANTQGARLSERLQAAQAELADLKATLGRERHRADSAEAETQAMKQTLADERDRTVRAEHAAAEMTNRLSGLASLERTITDLARELRPAKESRTD